MSSFESMQRSCVARKERMLSWLEKLTVDCWGWILFFLLQSSCVKQYKSLAFFFFFKKTFLYPCMCAFILCGFLCRSAECPLQWLKAVGTVVSF